MHRQRQRWRGVLATLVPWVVAGWVAGAAADDGAPLLVTVDDLPLSAGRLHADPGERERITRELLAVLAAHRVPAVGLVTWGNLQNEEETRLLEMWLDAGHELGNHGAHHLDYNRTPTEEFVADAEAGREALAALLTARGRRVRFFRFPYLHEGDSPAKLEAMRDYLEASGQRNLPVTFDNPDWRFERPWVEARRAGDAEAMARIGEEYHETMHMAVRYHEEVTRQVYTRTVPQILLLHAGEVGAAQWDRLFTWLTERGYRFADVDETLLDPVFEQVYSYTGGAGLSRWERLLDDRRHLAAEAVVKSLLIRQTEAWNRGDLEAFTSVYADDAVFVSPSGLTRGRDEVLERYRRRYPDSAAMGRLRFEIVEMRPVSGHETSVLGETRPGGVHGLSVVARWHLEFPDDPGREPASGSTLLVLHREPGGHWRIVQDASM